MYHLEIRVFIPFWLLRVPFYCFELRYDYIKRSLISIFQHFSWFPQEIFLLDLYCHIDRNGSHISGLFFLLVLFLFVFVFGWQQYELQAKHVKLQNYSNRVSPQGYGNKGNLLLKCIVPGTGQI